MLTGADGSATVQSGTVASGSYAARLSASSATNSFAYARATLAAPEPDLVIGGDFRIQAEGPSGANVPLLRILSASGTRVMWLYRQNLASNKLYLNDGTSAHLLSGTLALNTWAHVEMRISGAGTSAGTVEVRLNGALVYSGSINIATVRTVQIGNDTKKQPFILFADSITITR